MKCTNCENFFHYCNGCGYIGHADAGFCSDRCFENYFLDVKDKQKVVDLATYLLHNEVGLPDSILVFIQSYRQEVADNLLKFALREQQLYLED